MPKLGQEGIAAGASRGRGWFRHLGFASQQLIILLASFVPLVLLTAALVSWGLRENRAAVERGLTDTARALSIAIDEQISTWRSVLEALSTSSAFETGDFANFYDRAVAVAKQHGGGIVVFDERTAQVLNTRLPFGEPLPMPAYPEPVRRVFETGEVQVSGPFIGRVAKTWLVSIDVPVMRDGRVVYSLNFSTHPAHIADILDRQLLGQGWVAYVINDDGLFVSSTAGGTVEIGEAAPAWYVHPVETPAARIAEGPAPGEGAAQTLAFNPVGEAPWTLAVGLPSAAMAEAWQRKLWLVGGLSLVVVLVAAQLWWLFSRRVTRPIRALVQSADALLAGQEPVVTPLDIPELETLRLALMRASLVARQRIAAEESAAAAQGVAAEMRESEERQRLLAREVDHRAKNLLAVVQSIVQQTDAESTKTYKEILRGRLMALARSHSLIAESRWQGADLSLIVNDELAPYRAKRRSGSGAEVKAAGPHVTLRPAAAQSLAMVVHELTTNAVKYGALSSPNGRLFIEWGVSEEELWVTWKEAGGPAVAGPPDRPGFGMKIVSATVTQQLGGCIEYDWQPGGLFVRMVVPSARWIAERKDMQGDRERVSPSVAASDATVSLAARRVLVVEDEALIAAQVEGLLLEQGCDVVGPAPGVEVALALALQEPLDAAIIDANLSGRPSDGVADALRKRGIPFILLTGYADSGTSAAFRGAPLLTKPFDETALKLLLAGMMSRTAELLDAEEPSGSMRRSA